METKRQQSGNEPEPTKPATIASTHEPPAPVDEVPALESILASEPGEEPKAAATPEAAPEPPPAPPRKPRGFAAMDRTLVRELARRGARASQEKGTAHRFTSDEARAAGRKGGAAPHRIRGRGKSERPPSP